MRIPKNKISSSYASSGEFVYKQNREPFSGSYYSFNGTFYTGKEYSTSSLELQKVPPAQPILPYTNYDSALYDTLTAAVIGFTGGIAAKALSSIPTKSGEFLILAPQDPAQANINATTLSLDPATTKKRYFCRKLIPKPTESNPIKEITETEYNSLSSGINAVINQTAVLTQTTPRVGDGPPFFENVEEIKIAEQKIPGIKTFLGIP